MHKGEIVFDGVQFAYGPGREVRSTITTSNNDLNNHHKQPPQTTNNKPLLLVHRNSMMMAHLKSVALGWKAGAKRCQFCGAGGQNGGSGRTQWLWEIDPIATHVQVF